MDWRVCVTYPQYINAWARDTLDTIATLLPDVAWSDDRFVRITEFLCAAESRGLITRTEKSLLMDAIGPHL